MIKYHSVDFTDPYSEDFDEFFPHTSSIWEKYPKWIVIDWIEASETGQGMGTRELSAFIRSHPDTGIILNPVSPIGEQDRLEKFYTSLGFSYVQGAGSTLYINASMLVRDNGLTPEGANHEHINEELAKQQDEGDNRRVRLEALDTH
jgi:hypothetical protein